MTQQQNNKNSSVSECPGNQVRFGDRCFEELPDATASLLENADNCMDIGGHLWYPETSEEIAFVTQKFPGDLYHVGAKNYSKEMGFYFLDGTFSPGITFFSCKHTSPAKVHISRNTA